MNKILRYSFVALLAMMGFGNAMAEEKTVVIDFNTMDLACSHSANADQGVEASDAGDINETKTIIVDGVELIISPKEEDNKNPNRFWETKNGPQLRCYSGTITLKASENMTAIEFTSATSKFNLTAGVGTLDGKKWSGEATEVEFTVGGNTQLDKITITIGGEATPGPDPTAKGTKDNPYTVAEAIALLATMENNVKSDEVYVKGSVYSIDEISLQYGNATFLIGDDDVDGVVGLTVFRAKYFNKAEFTSEDQVMIGDKMVICGQLVNYLKKDAEAGTEPTPEIAQGCYVYMRNGKTSEDTPEPQVEEINVAKALDIINGLEDGAKTPAEYKITGYVVEVTEISLDYGNATFKIADEKGGTSTLTVFRAKDENGENITNENLLKADDLVVVQGKLQKYVKDGVMTPEVAQGGKILTINGQASSVNSVKAAVNANAAVYNLAGQRVNASYKGVVIKNGKKMIQK